MPNNEYTLRIDLEESFPQKNNCALFDSNKYKNGCTQDVPNNVTVTVLKLITNLYIVHHYTVSRPTMSELISMQKRDGSKGKLRIIEWITSHEPTQCVDFAHKLLVDPLPVKKLSKKHEENKEEFVRAVLQKWLDRDDDDENEESLPCTWNALVQSCEDANLDGVFIKLLRSNIPI